MEKLHKIIASGFGSGYSPLAPGTAGSIVGIILIYWGNGMLAGMQLNSSAIVLIDLLAIILVLLLGVYSISIVHRSWEHDAGKIVIDEIVGVWIAVVALPYHWKYYLVALILFRIFDIWKPLFIRKLDNMKNDWSVMLDDVLAGIYSLIVLQAIHYFKIL